MESPSLHILGELVGHWAELKDGADQMPDRGDSVHDARVAGICGEHGVRELWSADRDFTRVRGLVVRNPLKGVRRLRPGFAGRRPATKSRASNRRQPSGSAPLRREPSIDIQSAQAAGLDPG